MKKMERAVLPRNRSLLNRPQQPHLKTRTIRYPNRAFIRFQAIVTTRTCGWNFVTLRNQSHRVMWSIRMRSLWSPCRFQTKFSNWRKTPGTKTRVCLEKAWKATKKWTTLRTTEFLSEKKPLIPQQTKTHKKKLIDSMKLTNNNDQILHLTYK